MTAHRIETDVLKLECGIQDQLCSAYGGIRFIEMSRYPEATVTAVRVDDAVRWELERRLLVVYLGSAHVSSDVHRQVIRELEASGEGDPRLEGLRRAAHRGRAALEAGDLDAFAAAMRDNTALQAELHPEIVSEPARQVIAAARECGAAGWKVAARLAEVLPAARIVPVSLDGQGVRVWEVPASARVG
jgi:D-glycero-alpha-D-manno-heptose-7-phosphate kinase